MKFRFNLVHDLLFIITCVACQQGNPIHSSNQTDLPTKCSSANCTHPDKLLNPPVAGIPDGPPPFWCPDGYTLGYGSATWYQACQPQSCPGTKKNDAGNCTKISTTLRTCPKIYLTEDQYKTDDAGSLVDLLRNASVKPGFYVIEFARAVICDPEGNGTSTEPSNRAELPSWCMPMMASKGGYDKTAGQLFVRNINRHVKIFTVEPDGTAHVCLPINPMITARCGDNFLGILTRHKFEVLPDWGVSDTNNILDKKVYPLGEYILGENSSFVLVCIVASKPISKTVLYVYGVANLLSAFFLLLVLVAHLLYPALNYHEKTVVCLASSFLVMYVATTVSYLSDNFESKAANQFLFAVRYITSLGAFFWLSILSFDLWRVLANLRARIFERDTALKKRIFFIKCAYAWGIPTVLCIMVIAITNSPNVQMSLGIDLKIQITAWLHDRKTALIVFYTPIIIVLLENVIFFILTVVSIRNTTQATKTLRSNVNRQIFRVYCKLFLVMGLCWFFEIISWLTKHKTGKEVWYFTDVINCLQGVFIFIIYVFKTKTLLIIKQKMGYFTTSRRIKPTPSTLEREVEMEAVH